MVHSNVQSQVLTLICNEPLSSWQKQFREYQNCFQANILNVISSENSISSASQATKTRPTNIMPSSSPLLNRYVPPCCIRDDWTPTTMLARAIGNEMFWLQVRDIDNGSFWPLLFPMIGGLALTFKICLQHPKIDINCM